MQCIYNSFSTPTFFNQAAAGLVCVASLTAIALSIIGLTASGSFHAIVQFGATNHGILLGASLVIFSLDLVWMAALYKKTKEQPALLVEEISDIDSFDQQPDELILRIFSYLDINELTKCDAVCRKWKRLASDASLLNTFDLRTISPSLKIFDETDWATHVDLSSFGLDVSDAPPLNKARVVLVLKRYLSTLPVECNTGITLLTIPKGLTFNKLVKLAESPKEGNALKFRYIWDRIPITIGDIPVDRTYRIVITNNVLKRSRDLSFKAQKNLVRIMGCEVPKTLEAATLLVAIFISTGERLYHAHPVTATRCEEKVAGFQLDVGGFLPDGPFVTKNNLDEDEDDGVGGVIRNL